MDISNNFFASSYYKSQLTSDASHEMENDVPESSRSAEIAGKLRQLAAKFDLHNISPDEIDLLAEELKESGHISDNDWLMLLTKGAEFLAHTPGDYYTTERLAAKHDFLARMEEQILQAKSHHRVATTLEHLYRALKELDRHQNTPVKGVVV